MLTRALLAIPIAAFLFAAFSAIAIPGDSGRPPATPPA